MIEIFISADGREAQMVYDDAVTPALSAALGDASTRRASHVEPAESFGWECDGWLADMRPVGGPLLHDGYERLRPGVKRPFQTRQAALDAEVAWLRARMADGALRPRC